MPDGSGDTQQQPPVESEPMKIEAISTSESEPIAVTEASSVTTEPSIIENVAAVSSAAGHISEAANVAVSSGTGGQMVYTTADGSIVSAPEGAIMTNSGMLGFNFLLLNYFSLQIIDILLLLYVTCVDLSFCC